MTDEMDAIKMSFGRIYYIGWTWKSMFKIGYFKIFMRKNKFSTKWILLSFLPKYDN